MSVLRKVFSDSAFSAFRSVVTMARAIVVIPLITNLLGAESYGVWVTAFSAVSLLSATGSVHLHGSLVRYTSRESAENQTYSDVVVLTAALGGAVAVVVVVAGSVVDLAPLFEGAVADQFALVAVSALLILVTMLFNVNINFPRAKGRVKWYDALKLGRALVETLVLVAVFLLGGGVIAGLAALVVLAALMNLAVVSYVVATFPLPAPDPSNFRRYVGYGIPMVPKELAGSLLAHTDKYLLLYFLGPAAVGVYAVAQAVGKPLVSITGIFNPTLYPTIAREYDEGNFEEIADLYRTIFRFYSIVGVPATVGVIVLAEPLLALISTPDIARQGVVLVPLFILGYFVRGYDNSVEYILTSAERTDVIGGAVTATAVLNLVCNLALIPLLGMLGAALATLASQVFLFGVLVHYARTEIRFSVPWRSIGRSLLAALGMGALLTVLDLGLGTYASLAVYPVIGATVYFALLGLLGEFSGAERARLREALGEALAYVLDPLGIAPDLPDRGERRD